VNDAPRTGLTELARFAVEHYGGSISMAINHEAKRVLLN